MSVFRKYSALFLVFIVAGLGLSGCSFVKEKLGLQPPAPTPDETGSRPKVKTGNEIYKDGSYPVTEIFISPGGQETMKLNVFIKNDAVEHVDFSGTWSGPVAQSINDGFGATLVQNALGKGVDEEIDAITGATLSVKSFVDGVKLAFEEAKK